jgi:hypothetical protein
VPKGVRRFMDVMPLLHKLIGVFAASTCCAAVTALLFWAPSYADKSSGFMGMARSWSGLAAVVGAAVGCALGAVIGLLVVLSGVGWFTGALIGTLAMMAAAAVWFQGMSSSGLAYAVAGALLIPAGTLAGVVASQAPSWSRGSRLSSSPLLTTVFALFLGAPLILLVIAAGVRANRKFVARRANRAHLETVAMLDNARVEVSARDARVISDDGQNVLAEVTFEINNVPSSLPFYEMNVHVVGQADSYYIGANRVSNGPDPNPYLKVTSSNGGWLFHDIFMNRTVSDDARNVTLRFEFSRRKAAPNELPDTVTPRLGIWARDDKVYRHDYLFFYKPIPVSFRRGPGDSNQAH